MLTSLAFKLFIVVFIMLLHVKMPTIVTIVGIITLMSMIIFVLISVEHEKSFINLGPDPTAPVLVV